MPLILHTPRKRVAVQNTLNYASYQNGAKLGNGANPASDTYAGPNAYNRSLYASGNSGWVIDGAIVHDNATLNTFDRPQKAAQTASTCVGAGSAASPFSLVVDLGRVRDISLARYYQTFSDGKCTHVAMDSSTTGNLESCTSANWQQVHGFALVDNETGSGTAVAVSLTARFLRFRMYNDGRYGSGGYTELYAIKLF